MAALTLITLGILITALGCTLFGRALFFLSDDSNHAITIEHVLHSLWRNEIASLIVSYFEETESALRSPDNALFFDLFGIKLLFEHL